jgi:hypothetical protein
MVALVLLLWAMALIECSGWRREPARYVSRFNLTVLVDPRSLHFTPLRSAPESQPLGTPASAYPGP